jgi:hypothetical protein
MEEAAFPHEEDAMITIADLNEQEKIFLAGAIKALLLADGAVDDAQLDDLDRLVEGLGFDDFDEHLVRFEKVAASDQDFEFLARNIFHPQSKALISSILDELAVQKGIPTPEDDELIGKIREWWKE